MSKPKRRWYQFSLLTLFVLTAIVAGFTWGIPLARDHIADRINGWPKPISGIEISNRSEEMVKDVQVISSDGTILLDPTG